jgi:poly(ADP-ribose) glycohydrolase ARH3
MENADRFAGCLLGLATGDALGAPYEGGPLERLIWRLIGRARDGTLRWTDDTQMSLDLAESLLAENGLSLDALATRFAAGYRWSRGYGPGAAKVLRRIRRGQSWRTAVRGVYPEGSFGNGAAMRAPVLALYFRHDRAELVAAARESAGVTHAHPLGIEGAVLIALATHALLEDQDERDLMDRLISACSSAPFYERLRLVRFWRETQAMPSPRDVVAKLGNGITAPTSCPTALFIALQFRRRSFEEMMTFIISCRGDVDTIGAMAGALWGVTNGAERLPRVRLEHSARIVEIAGRLHRHHRRES